MSEHKLKERLANELRGRPYWQFRVIETVRDGKPFMAIHKVDFDARGMPVQYDDAPAGVGGEDGDALVRLLNELAMALTKPSLVAADFPVTEVVQ